jgi:hypothetical protein
MSELGQTRKWRCTGCESVRPRITNIDQLSAIVARMRRHRCIKPTRTESDVTFSAYTENPFASDRREGAYLKAFLIAFRWCVLGREIYRTALKPELNSPYGISLGQNVCVMKHCVNLRDTARRIQKNGQTCQKRKWR